MQAELTYRYRMARAEWAASPIIQQAAKRIAITERGYCDDYVRLNFSPLLSVSDWTTIMRLDTDRAFAEAET